jgi:hypothetical protein
MVKISCKSVMTTGIVDPFYKKKLLLKGLNITFVPTTSLLESQQS